MKMNWNTSCFTALFVCIFSGLIGCKPSSSNVQQAESKPDEAPVSKPENAPAESDDEVLSKSLVELKKAADQQNLNGEYDRALETWKEIHTRVSDEFGLDAWQTVSAELAMTVARQRTRMSTQDHQMVSELAKWNQIILTELAMKRYEKAVMASEKATNLSTQLWGKESYVSANINFLRARSYLGARQFQRAIAVLKDVRNLRISLTGKHHPDVETAVELLAKAQEFIGDFASSIENRRDLVEISGELWGKDNLKYSIRCNDLGVALNGNGQPKLAIEQFNQVLELRQKLYGDDSVQVGHVRINIGLAYARLGDRGAASRELSKAYDVFKSRKLNPNDPVWVTLLDQLGVVCILTGENQKAQQYYSELADQRKAVLGEESLEYGKCLFKLSVCLGNQGKYSEADPIMRKAIQNFEANLGPNDQRLHQPLTTFARMQEKMGNSMAASQLKDRAIRIANQSNGQLK